MLKTPELLDLSHSLAGAYLSGGHPRRSGEETALTYPWEAGIGTQQGLQGYLPRRGADGEVFLPAQAGRGASALYFEEQEAAAPFRTAPYAGSETGRAEEEARALDRALRRDSRRYDNGFFLY